MRKKSDGTITFYGGLQCGVSAYYDPEGSSLTFCSHDHEGFAIAFQALNEEAAVELWNRWARANNPSVIELG